MPICVTPLINVTDMEAWYPYFSLEPNPERWAGVGTVGMLGVCFAYLSLPVCQCKDVQVCVILCPVLFCIRSEMFKDFYQCFTSDYKEIIL